MKIPPFEKFPRPIRQAAVSIIGWKNRRLRFADEYRDWCQLLIESNYWDERERTEWQKMQLLGLVERSKSGTKHYSGLAGIAADKDSQISLREYLDSIPVLEKSLLRERPQDFRNFQVPECTETSTSGSTGSPMKFGHDAKSIQRRFAFLYDQPRLANVDPLAPSVRLSGRILCQVGKHQKKPWLYNAAENQLFLSSYHLNESHAEVVKEKLVAFAPALLDGYPSGILEVLRLLKRQNVQLDSLRAIITTAETLHPDLRDELSSLSGVPIMDYYSASEGVPFIQQCPLGTYHVRWQSGIFEIDNGEKVGFEGDGELICTSFVQDRTPLIRYRTGDLVKGYRAVDSESCGCGLRTPTVAGVMGRVEDLIYTPDGRALGMFTYRTLKLIEGLGETQVIQHDYDKFEVNCKLSVGAESRGFAAEVKESFERALGYAITLKFNAVADIPRGASGKLRLVISKVARSSE